MWAAHERQGDVRKAGVWLRRMLADGFPPGLGPYAWMIQNSLAQEAVKWLRQMQAAHFAPNVLSHLAASKQRLARRL